MATGSKVKGKIEKALPIQMTAKGKAAMIELGNILYEPGMAFTEGEICHASDLRAMFPAYKKGAHQEIEWVNPMGNAA